MNEATTGSKPGNLEAIPIEVELGVWLDILKEGSDRKLTLMRIQQHVADQAQRFKTYRDDMERQILGLLALRDSAQSAYRRACGQLVQCNRVIKEVAVFFGLLIEKDVPEELRSVYAMVRRNLQEVVFLMKAHE